MSTKTRQHLWYGAFAANLLVIFYFWQQGSGGLLRSGFPEDMVLALSCLCALVGGYLLLVQLLLMSRLPILERVFGLDVLSRHHQTNGLVAYVFVITHVLTITLAYSAFERNSFIQQIFAFLENYQFINGAVIGFVLLLGVVVTSVIIVRRHLKYESWYYVHLLAYAGVLLPLGHQITLGGDLIKQDVFRYYWVGLYAVVFVSILAFRFIRPLWLLKRHDFRVEKVEPAGAKVVSVYITGKHLDKFRHQAGQFAIFRFLAQGYWTQAHPFTISWEPQQDGRLRVSAKAVGDYTATLPQLKPGTRVLVDGPYGRFTLAKATSSKLLFIAGGIGITPLRAMLGQAAGGDADTALLYAARTADDVALKHELEQLVRKRHYVLSDEQKSGYEQGFVTAELIQRLVPDATEREVFLCGPVPMMDAVTRELTQLGVPKRKIYTERFSLHKNGRIT